MSQLPFSQGPLKPLQSRGSVVGLIICLGPASARDWASARLPFRVPPAPATHPLKRLRGPHRLQERSRALSSPVSVRPQAFVPLPRPPQACPWAAAPPCLGWKRQVVFLGLSLDVPSPELQVSPSPRPCHTHETTCLRGCQASAWFPHACSARPIAPVPVCGPVSWSARPGHPPRRRG